MKPIKKSYYYYGGQQYSTKDLAVYLVWCEPTDNKKFDPVVIPVLAPRCDDITHPKGNSSTYPGDSDKKFYFPTLDYIKAVAKKKASSMPIDENNPKSWRPDAYKFSTVRIRLESFQMCIDDERGKNVQSMIRGNYTFRDMAADYVLDEGSVPVTYKELQEIADEEEELVEDVVRRIKDYMPPSNNTLH